MIERTEISDQIASYYVRNKRKINLVLGLVFLVGAWGIAIPRSQILDRLPVFIWLLTVFIFQTHAQKSSVFIFKFLLLILAGWAIEVLGVQGGILFGKYGYGNLFGWKIIEVPAICGAIWLINTLSMMQLARYVLRVEGYWKIMLVAALLMTALDAFAQLPAFKIGFWSYKDLTYPPYFHSIGYFGISLLTCSFGGEEFAGHKNHGAITLAILMPAFLVILYIMTLLFR